MNGTEGAPGQAQAEKYAKFMSRRDRALATIVLSVEPSLLYLLGERRKLYSLRLKEGESVQKHIKVLTELFEGLAVIGDPIKEEDRVVHLLASLPEPFNMLVTALEASTDVPNLDVVTERLLHEERKLKDREGSGSSHEKAMTSRFKRKSVECFHCGKTGHIKRNCHLLSGEKKKFRPNRHGKQKANKASVVDECSADSGSDALMVSHKVLSASTPSKWIIDSGASCHMCCDSELFDKLEDLKHPIDVSIGDDAP